MATVGMEVCCGNKKDTLYDTHGLWYEPVIANFNMPKTPLWSRPDTELMEEVSCHQGLDRRHWVFKLLSVSIWDTSKVSGDVSKSMNGPTTIQSQLHIRYIIYTTLINQHNYTMGGLGGLNPKYLGFLYDNTRLLPSSKYHIIVWLQYTILVTWREHSLKLYYHKCSTLDCVFISIKHRGKKEPTITNVVPLIQAITT